MFLVPWWKTPRFSSCIITLADGCSNSGATRFVLLYSVAHGDGPEAHHRRGLLKVIAAGQKVPGLEEEENPESLVCMVLSALQELETSKVCSCFSALCGNLFL